MRRINRGLFQLAIKQVALENEEVSAVEETRPVTEVTAATDNVEVTVKVESTEVATVEKTDKLEEAPATASEVVPATQDAVAEVTEVTPEEKPAEVVTDAQKRISELEAEIARLKSGEVVATEDEVTVDTAAAAVDTTAAATAVADTAVDATAPATTDAIAVTDTATTVTAEETPAQTTVAEGETAVVKDAAGETVATVTTTDSVTTVTTAETVVEVVQTEDKVAVEVTVLDTPSISAEDMTVIETDGERTEVEIQDAVDNAEDTAELMEECDDAEDTAMVLESFVEIAASAASNGGLDIHGARILKVAAEHIYSHMGMGKALGIPAMESFNIDEARVSATSIALEDIREQAKKIWAAVVEGVKKAIQWVQEFVTKIFNANAHIKARAEKLLAASEKMTGMPKAKTVGNATLVKSLTLGGKVPSNLAGEVKKAVDFFEGSANSHVAETISNVIKAIEQAKTTADADKAEAMVLAAISTVTGKGLQYNNVANSLGARVGVAEAPDGTSISMTQRFLGEQVVWAYIPKSTDAVASFRSGIGIDPNTSKVAEDAQANVLTPAQIADVAKVALAFVETSKAYSAFQKDIGMWSDGVAKVIGTMAAADAFGKGEGTAAKMKGVLSSLKTIRHLIKGIHQPAAVVASRVVSASLNLATESAKQYDAKAA
jgi:hypothetical protein